MRMTNRSQTTAGSTRRAENLALLCTLTLLLWSTACHQGEESVAKPPPRPVRVTRVLSTGGRQLRTFSGSARSGLESKLSFRVPGTIEKLDVKLGDRVQKGQVLAELEDNDYRLQVDEAEAGLAQAQAQSRNAAAHYARIRDLYEANNVSINDLDGARAGTESAQAQVVSITKKLELARSQMAYTRLVAPLSGSIADLNVEVNENVRAGQAIVTLNAGSRPETTFVVPEQLITEIREGDACTVRFDALPDKEFSATITEVGVASGNLATTYPVTARLDQPNEDIRQGMATEVLMIFGQSDGQSRLFAVPNAVVEDRDGRFVLVALPTGEGLATVVRRTVETGKLSGDGLEILTGLADGDLVITAGIRFLSEGMTVKLPAGVKETSP